MSQTRVPCHCSKCGLAFAVVYEIDKPGPLTWSTIACPRRTCKNVVRVPIPQDASFTVDAPGVEPVREPEAPPRPEAVPPPVGSPEPVGEERAPAPERSETLACASCGHSYTLSYKYLDADAETVIWVQCPNCGSSMQVWVLEGAHDLRL